MGYDRASDRALRRWEHDCYRVQPYQYEDKNMIRVGNTTRRLVADEQARILGFTSHHLDVVTKKVGKKAAEDAKGQFTGNTFAVVIVARLLSGFCRFGEEVTSGPEGPGTLSWLWKQWDKQQEEAVDQQLSQALPWSQQHGATSSTSRHASRHEPDKLSEDQHLVAAYLRIADHRGSDVRLDAGVPYRLSAWPRVAIASSHWAWRVLLSYQWRFKAHINILEAQAVFDAMRTLLKNPQMHDCRRFCLVDSQAVLGCLTKGRSSSRRLNYVCVRLAALLRAANVHLFYGWVASKANPADGPSRWAIKQK